MESKTAILLLAFAPPIAPTHLHTFDYLYQGGMTSDSASATKVSTPNALGTVAKVSTPTQKAEISRLDSTIQQIKAFGSQASSDAERFLGTLPAGFPIPHAAHGEDDVITLFWDIGHFYADIEFHGDGLMSVFTRLRGKQNIDHGYEGITLSQSFNSWGYDYLNALAPAVKKTA